VFFECQVNKLKLQVHLKFTPESFFSEKKKVEVTGRFQKDFLQLEKFCMSVFKKIFFGRIIQP